MENSLDDIFEQITISAYEFLVSFSEIPGSLFLDGLIDENRKNFFISDLSEKTDKFLEYVRSVENFDPEEYQMYFHDVIALRHRVSRSLKGTITSYSLIRNLDEWAFSDPYLVDYLDRRERYFDKIRINTYIRNYILRKQKEIFFEPYNRFNGS